MYNEPRYLHLLFELNYAENKANNTIQVNLHTAGKYYAFIQPLTVVKTLEL